MRARVERPIGVFDSGLGGLTVVRALLRALPGERIAYLGDTARLPYGSKSADTVALYSLKASHFLLGLDVKLLVVACNTASAFALEILERELPVPVLGAVGPGADEAVAATKNGSIGVIGTLGTIRSGAYHRAVAARDPALRVTELACPLLVPLVEEGWLGDGAPLEARAAESIARRYLEELHERAPDLDVLVLGCTHYPLLAPLLARLAADIWDHEVKLVDSADAMARAATRALDERHLRRTTPLDDATRLACYLTDEARFREVGSRFLGRPLDLVEKVDL